MTAAIAFATNSIESKLPPLVPLALQPLTERSLYLWIGVAPVDCEKARLGLVQRSFSEEFVVVFKTCQRVDVRWLQLPKSLNVQSVTCGFSDAVTLAVNVFR